MSSKKAVVYLNLGTPDNTDVPSVRRYLRQFLMDPFVLDIPFLFRWILVNIIIVPFRAPKSAEAYKLIWKGDSPLRSFSESLVRKLSVLFSSSADVFLVMRYGRPSTRSVIEEIVEKKYDSISVFPAYPQYALSSTETGFEEIRKELKRSGYKGELKLLKDYYQDPLFLDAIVEKMRPLLSVMKPDFVLFSFHGLPKRHLTKINTSCFKTETCCNQLNEGNRLCYRRQSFATAHGLAARLGLTPEQFKVSFQSRLGSGWIEPFTDVVIEELAKNGIKKLAVVCPSFTVDCLETLEEIAMRGRETFVEAGGEELELIPCLNDSETWVANLKQLVETDTSFETIRF